MLHCIAGERQRDEKDSGLHPQVRGEERVVALADTCPDPEAVVVKCTHAVSAGVAVMRAQRCLFRAFATRSQALPHTVFYGTVIQPVIERQ